jgi:hypothetical protein
MHFAKLTYFEPHPCFACPISIDVILRGHSQVTKKLDGVIARRALPDKACVLKHSFFECRMPDLPVRDEIATLRYSN